jgi:hypothetical protein
MPIFSVLCIHGEHAAPLQSMVKSVVGMDYQHVGRTVTVSDKMILHSKVHEMTSFVYHTNALIRAFNVISSETRNFSSVTKIHNCVPVSINISLSGPLKFETM